MDKRNDHDYTNYHILSFFIDENNIEIVKLLLDDNTVNILFMIDKHIYICLIYST